MPIIVKLDAMLAEMPPRPALAAGAAVCAALTLFRRDSRDIHLDLPITLNEALHAN